MTDTSVQTQGKAGITFVKDLSIIANGGNYARGIDVDNDAYVNADQNYRGLVVVRGNGANLSVGGALTVEATAGEVRAIGVNVNDASVTVAGAADITATATGNEAEAIGVQVVSGTLDFAGDAKISATGGASSLAASVGDGGVVNFGGSNTVLTGRVDVLQNGTINVNAGNATMESFTIAKGGRVNVAANAKLTTLTGQIFSAALNEAGDNTGEGMQKLYSDDSLALAAGSHLAFNDAKYNSSYAYAAGALYSGVTLVFNGNRVDTNRVLYETLPESSDTVESNVDVVVSASQQGTATLTKTFGVSSVIASNEALNKVEIGGKTTLVGDSSGTKELVSFAGSGDNQVKVSSTGTLQLGQDGSSANKGVISAGIQTLGKLIVSAGEYVLDALELGNDGSLKVDNGSTLSISASSDGDVDALRLNDASTVNLVSGTLNLTAETSQSADQYGDDEITAKALNHHSSSATFETAAGTSLVLKATSTGTGIASADAEAAHIEGVTTFGGTVNATASAVGGYAQGMVTHGDVVFNDKVWLTASSDTNAAIALGAEESRGTSNSAKITFNGDATLTASSNAGVSTLPEDAGADGAAYGLDISPSDNLGQGQVDGQVVTAAGTTLTIRASTNSQAQDAGSAIGLTGSGNAQFTAAGAVDIGATANGKGDAFGVRWNGGTAAFNGDAAITATSASGEAVGVKAEAGTVKFAGDTTTITAANALLVSGGTVEFAGKTAQVINLTAGNTTMESFTIAEGGKVNVASGAQLTTLTGQIFTIGLDSEGTNSGEGLAKRYDETRLGLASNSTLAFNDPKYNAVYMANASALYSDAKLAKLVFNGTRVEFAEGETANVNVKDLPDGTDVVETNVNAKISCDQDQQTVSLDKSVGVSAVVVNGDSVTKLEVTQQVTLVGSADGDKELIQFSGSGEKQVTLTAAGSSLTLGQEGSTANAGKISVALTVQNQTSLTVKEGSYTLSDVTASTGGKIEVSNGNVAVDKLTLDGGNLTAENGQLTAQTMTLGKSSVISLGDAITQIATLVIDAIQDAVHTITGEMKTDSLQVKEGASSFIRIGTSTAQGDQENKAGRLEIAKNFIMKGLTFFLDPVYQNGTIADASKLSVASTSIDGKIAVGENSYAVLGSQGADADQKMIDDSGIAWDGTTNSALFVAQPVTITSTGGILVDKTATATSSIADGSVTFAANSVLVANASAAETAAITAHSFSIADNAKAILVGDLDESKTYTLLAKEDGSALGDGEFFKNVTPANAMWELDGTGSGSGQYKFVIVDAGKVYGDLMQGTEIATSAMRGKGTAAEKRYANSLLEQVEGESRADAASRFDAAMNPAQALTTFTTAYDRAAETRKFVREEAEKAQDNRLWVHVTGGKTKLKGVGTGSSQKLHTKTSSYGIVVGGQAAVNDSLTLGAAFSAGAGSTKNNSVSGKDKFDYYGLSVYGATSLGAVDLKADASVMLLKSDISIGGAADVKSDVKTYVYSLGLEAGRTFDLGAVDVTPFIGADVYHVRGHGFNNGHGASVKKSDATAVEFPIGARIGKAFETQGGFSVAPAFSLAVVPTVADRKVDSKVCFAGAESTYRYTFTDDVKVRTSLGLDVKKGNFSAGLHAGYEWGNEERSSTSVQLRAKYMF